MIKRLTLWHTRPGEGREEALRYWYTEHATLVRQLPGLCRYVQNHCVKSPDGGEPPHAGLGEVWFDSADAAQEAAASTEWAAVIEDVATFMDIHRVVAAWAEEHSLL